jgi:hypothetical protein
MISRLKSSDKNTGIIVDVQSVDFNGADSVKVDVML